MEKITAAALPTLDHLNKHRKYLSNLFSEYLEETYQIKNKGNAVSIIRFPVLFPNTMLTKEMKRMGIRRMYPKAISDESSIKPYLKYYHQNATPGATEIASKLLTLPTHMKINESMAKEISIVVQENVRRN